MQSAGIATSEHYKRQMSGRDIHVMLKAKIDALSYVGGINLFDADGVLINSSSAWPVPAVNVADRAYFKTFKSDPHSPSLLVEPVYSRITGAWTTVLARKLTGPNGEFLGAIGRGIEPASFEKFFASVALGRRCGDLHVSSRRHAAGALSACRGDDRAEFQDRSDPSADPVRAGPRHDTADQPVDGQDRLASARALSDFPIVDHRDHDGVGGAGRLARANQVSDHRRRTLRARDRRHAVSGGSQTVAAAPDVAATADAGKAASRHRGQQYDARPAAVRRIAAAHRLQPALSRDVRGVARRGQAGLHHSQA